MDYGKDIDVNLILLSDKYIKEKKYWMKKLDGNMGSNYLPYDFDEEQEGIQEKYEFSFQEDIFEKFKAMTNNSNMSMYLILLTCLKILLYKYSKNLTITVGSPLYKTNYSPNLLNHMVALKDDLYDQLTFKEFLLQVRNTVLEAYENQNYPLVKIIEEFSMSKIINSSTLCNTVCLLTNLHDEEFIKEYGSDIIFSFTRHEDEMKGSIYYHSGIYSRETIDQFFQHFTTLLREVMKNPMIVIDKIDIISEEEKDKLLYRFNQTDFDYDRNTTLHKLWEEQVENTPHNIALVYQDKKLTYKEANGRANQVGGLLRKYGVKNNDIVGIMMEPSLEMMIGILGILKAGGAYLPIDHNNPQNRIDCILEESKTKYLLTKKNIIQNQQLYEDIEIIYIEDLETIDARENLNIATAPQDLAYVIYTSGSSGKPKGVMIEHRNLLAYIVAFNQEFKLTSEDVVLQQASYCFDAFVEEVYPILLRGGTLVIASEEEIKEVDLLVNRIINNRVTLISSSPLMLNELNRYENLNTIKTFIGGGDVLKEKYIHHLRRIGAVYNTYGPTETTVCATYYKSEKGNKQNILIGRPIANYRTYIIDENNQLAPIGIAGELCIAGEGVARGYLYNEELTEMKFVENPHRAGERMYKTGDLARWLSSGDIEFLGRIDNQVKIRGYRIELGEIENTLLKYEKIKEVVVLDQEDPQGEKELWAYIVSDSEVTVSDLRDYLNQSLPEYMIPAYFINLDKIPLNTSGKVDRKALKQSHNIVKSGIDYVAPRNEIETILMEIWKDILATPQKFGVKDNFFALGGHSLKATTVAAEIHKRLNVDVSLMELFKRTTIEDIALYIGEIEEKQFKIIEKVEEKEHYVLSSAQKRMYIINQMDPSNTNYNMPMVLKLQGNIMVDRIQLALEKLIERHETLRTSFIMVEGEPVQKIVKNLQFKLEYKEIEIENITSEIDAFIRPFNLAQAPLLRVGLYRLQDKEWIMMVDMHHIISDGLSEEIIIEEFSKIYNHQELPPLRIQYKDYAIWQQQMMESGELKKQENYWINRFKGEIPLLKLPLDYPRTQTGEMTMVSINSIVGHEISEGLKNLATENDATLYMVLLAAYNTLLYRYTGQEEIIVGSVIAGRTHPDLKNVVGMFVNMLAMKNNPFGDKTFKDFLREVKTNAIEAFENQDYQFEELVKHLDIKREIGRTPLFDTVFGYKTMSSVNFDLPDLRISLYENEVKDAKFDVLVNVSDIEDGLGIYIDYKSGLFKQSTMENFIMHYGNILKEIATNSEVRLSEIDILVEEEIFHGENEKTATNIEAEFEM